MRLNSGLRKFVLSLHLACSVGWIGAVVMYLALGIAAATSQDALTVRAAWIAMDLSGWWAIVPLSIAALLTGIAISVGTPWGLFRHYWVIFSLGLTIVATVVLVLHMPTVSALAAAARDADSSHLVGSGGDLFHPGVGLVLLLAIMGLNVYKPRGLTPYGWRKQLEQRAEPSAPLPQASVTPEACH
jgi:hypothetical protein